MKASALLTAVALLVGAAGAELDVNLNIVFDEIAKLNVSSQNFFVEDVRHLAEGVNGCRAAFFCKVHDVLKHENFSKWEEKQKLEKQKLEKPKKNKLGMIRIKGNLIKYLDHRNVNCSVVLKAVNASKVQIQPSEFWNITTTCIRTCNLQGCK